MIENINEDGKRDKMKTLGVILIGIGIILAIIRLAPEIYWIVILVGIVFLLIGYLLKTKDS